MQTEELDSEPKPQPKHKVNKPLIPRPKSKRASRVSISMYQLKEKNQIDEINTLEPSNRNIQFCK